MNDPDITQALIERVSTECPVFRTVEQAWFAAPLDDFSEEAPACMIYPADDGPAGEINNLSPMQPIRLRYGFWIVASRDQFLAARQQVREALFAWVAGEHHGPLEYGGGQTTDIKGEYIWWREFWTVDTELFR